VAWNNPFYPVSLLGFPGLGSAAKVIIGANEPHQLRHLPFGLVQALLTSWFYDLHRHSYIYDQRLGGFGVQWPLLVAPALLIAVVWFARHRRSYLLGLVVPVVLVALASSASWWSRYTIALAGAGCVGLALCLEKVTGWKAQHRARGSKWRFGATAASFLAPLFVVATGLSMWWATNPSGYLMIVNGSVQYGTVSQVAHAMTLRRPEAVISPWFSYGDLDRLVPAGSPLGVIASAGNQTFTYPLIGENLQRRLVVVGTPTASAQGALTGLPEAAAQLAAELAHSGVRFVLLDHTPQTATLVAAVDADPTRFLPLTSGGPVNGGDLYQIGTWPICTKATLRIVSDSSGSDGTFRMTAQYGDSCGVISGAAVYLYEGDKRLPLYGGSDVVVKTGRTDASGSVTFAERAQSADARYFVRADGQRTGTTFHQAAASGVVSPAR
jgi:hypothetical protein